jgi:hypothetical protein
MKVEDVEGRACLVGLAGRSSSVGHGRTAVVRGCPLATLARRRRQRGWKSKETQPHPGVPRHRCRCALRDLEALVVTVILTSGVTEIITLDHKSCIRVPASVCLRTMEQRCLRISITEQVSRRVRSLALRSYESGLSQLLICMGVAVASVLE